MTRLESSARDYAIACLATGESMGRALSAFRGPVFDAAFRVWSDCPEADLPLVRARLALHLRLLRRVEAWERRERWAEWRWLAVRAWDAEERLTMVAQATPWRPLWTLAPAHRPGATARLRRER